MTAPQRSLLLAGGGMKVAFQAGVLQVLLSEARMKFHHYDACSGGAFNLAMLCDGRTGIEIADAWRRTRPADGVSARWQDLVRVPFAQRSLITLDAYRKKVFRQWGLDFDRINASPLEATFTVHNRNTGKRETFSPEQMDEDRLVACLSQAVWFPPVEIDGTIYTDAVFDTDANVDEALARGATEIWVIWTVSRRPEWMPGLMAQFFHALEISANGTLEKDLERAEAQGAKVCRIEAEVPVHYLVLMGADRLHRAVEMGVRTARRWCDLHGYKYAPIDRGSLYDSHVTLSFADHLSGRLGGKAVDVDLTLIVEDAGEFVSAGRQRARLEGTVTCSLLEGTATVDGWAHILVNAEVKDGNVVTEDPSQKRMEYVVHLRTPTTGRELTLIGTKAVETRSLAGVLRETTTMPCRLLEGHVGPGQPAVQITHGMLWMSWRDVLHQLLTAKADGPGRFAEVKGTARFAGLFVGNLWDVAARRVLPYAPF